MKINKTFKKTPLAQLIALSLVAGVTAGNAFAAAPLAGTEIKNLATVTYEDANGNTYTAQSNEAVITVAEQFRATLENDRTQSSAPGQTVYFPHTLVNTGNTPDTYTLGADNGAVVYLDTNGNGQPDSGESVVVTVTLGAGETANLVVGYNVPSGAADGSNETVTFTATSGNAAGIVEDIGTNGDEVATPGTDPSGAAADNNATNTDIVNITTGPVLVLNKEAVFDPTNNRVTYTLTVKNTGGSDAKLVDIIDAVPMVDTDGAGTMLPLTNVTIVSVNGLLASNGDTVPAIGAAVLVSMDETVLNTDLNGDGDELDTAVDVIKATDAVIESDTTVSITYSADYDSAWHAGESIDNTFIASFDEDDNPATPKIPVPSNTTNTKIPQIYAVIAEDDAVTPDVASPGVNDGLDDDATDDNNTQEVDTISSGDTVIFTHTVTNSGNGDDIFNLAVANAGTDPFPPNTVFTLWNATGNVKLTDSDGDSSPDTGVLVQGQTTTVLVKATLPAGTSGSPAGGYNAVLTATSSASTASDTTNLKLLAITAPAVDLAAVTDNAGVITNEATAQPATGFNDGGGADAHDLGPVIFKDNVALGETVEFPMSIANESGSADSFILTYANLPTGWSAVFKDASGSIITATTFLPAGATFNYSAYVTVSENPVEAEGDSPRLTDVDGYDGDGSGTLIGTDTDKDYVIQFIATSAGNNTRFDTIKHAIDVASTSLVSVTPDGQNQIQPGGTVDYPHKLTNDGNVDELIELTSVNTNGAWNTKLLIDTTGDGIGDTELSNLTTTDTFKVYNPDGTTTDVLLQDTEGPGDGLVEFTLEPGQYVKLTNKVFAPADAPQGTVNATTVTAHDVDNSVRNIATDTSNVILGQVRLSKTVAIDADCDAVAEGSFAAILSTQVEPGECAVWQIVAKNEGDAIVKNVIVTDTIPAYTASLPGSLRYCKQLGCAPTLVGDLTTDGDAGSIDADIVTFYVGDNSDPVNKVGGDLDPGESATARFTVKIDQ